MNIAIRLTKIEFEMLRELQKIDRAYKGDFSKVIASWIRRDYQIKTGARG